MPIPEHMGGFIAAAVLVTVLPGPDFVLITRNTARGGRRGGLATAAGSVTGIAAWALLATAGLSVLVASHPAVLHALRLAGAAYLVYLGGSTILALWRARRSGAGGADAAAHHGGADRSGSPYLQGLVNNLLNPKLPVMFVTVLPQFVSAPEAAVQQTALLGAVLVAMVVVWWLVYVLGISALSEIMRRRRVRQGIDLAGGVALTAFGVALALAA
ncbi:LysE family translocator [Nocardiopsis chromatogenes]|uniref:LysE family translocator n=1 Tax=Nocardiopsis chromatogenes TaxID=280239 RepID=UPI0003468A61|nr:LysE family translocator [Nocardiopsis chromatogenes]